MCFLLAVVRIGLRLPTLGQPPCRCALRRASHRQCLDSKFRSLQRSAALDAPLRAADGEALGRVQRPAVVRDPAPVLIAPHVPAHARTLPAECQRRAAVGRVSVRWSANRAFPRQGDSAFCCEFIECFHFLCVFLLFNSCFLACKRAEQKPAHFIPIPAAASKLSRYHPLSPTQVVLVRAHLHLSTNQCNDMRLSCESFL